MTAENAARSMRVLVLDTFQHFPSLYAILKGECEVSYYALVNHAHSPLERSLYEPHPHQFQIYGGREDFRRRYGFEPSSLEEAASRHYDAAFWTMSPFDFLPQVSGNRSEFSRSVAKRLSALLRSCVHGDVFIVDNSDCPLDPTALLRQEGIGFTSVLKREYLTNRRYHSDVRPFPFVTFGRVDPLWLLLHERREGKREIDACLWAGSSIRQEQPELGIHCRREQVLLELSPHLMMAGGLPFEEFRAALNRTAFFLNLKGVGQLCRRLFEGMAEGALMLTERLDLVFPFWEWLPYHEEVSFSSPAEFIGKFRRLRSDPSEYRQALELQGRVLERCFSRNWFIRYLNQELGLSLGLPGDTIGEAGRSL